MNTFTLDTNCILALEEERGEAEAIRRLILAHDAQTANVALVAISASENQQNGLHLEHFNDFKARLGRLRLGHLPLLKPTAYWGVAFWEWCVLSDPQSMEMERKLHEVLFPDIPFDNKCFCERFGVALSHIHQHYKWRNTKCDVLALQSHVREGRDVFVTSDRNFHQSTKKPRLESLANCVIATPEEALSHLDAS
jgi:hypothetical protein